MVTDNILDDNDISHRLWFPDTVYILRGVSLIIISLFGAIFNAFMVIAIVPNRRLRTVRNVLLVHLGSVGLAASVITTFVPAIVILKREWIGGSITCQIYAFVNSILTCVSVWTITALSWDKYQTIAAPLHHSLTATFKKMSGCFLGFWMCAVALCLPPLMGANEYALHPAMGLCAVRGTNVHHRWYTVVYICCAFCIPLALVIYCYAHIFRIARTQSSRIAATMVRMVSVIQAPIAPANPTTLSMRGTKAMSTILQLVGSFALTYIPYSVVLSYEICKGDSANSVLVSISTTFFQAAPFTNAAIYGLRNKILRGSFYRYTRRKIQHLCYKDTRRGSFKAIKKSTSTARLPVLNRKLNLQNGNNLKRTYSVQVRLHEMKDNDLLSAPSLPRAHSYTGVTNGQPFLPLISEKGETA
ncbi:visual pigment-like receptor peropsin [Patella vulgata]|uniref:visual pigment-like receptor peropsin n=1 Tax=Patella vulgata TaxID=6465 RepID=UPI0021803A45|nr:visual pigment-like receptor peropsin [Patella vulgata]